MSNGGIYEKTQVHREAGNARNNLEAEIKKYQT